jgi:two-component system phosphate regulon sensor histidine kinase PhoR
MKNLRTLPLLMTITILGITGFQLYWLYQNYDREEKALDIKTEITFQETVQDLQVSKLRLDGKMFDSATNSKVRVIMSDSQKEMKAGIVPKQEILSTVNIIREKLKDSMKAKMVFTMDKKFSASFNKDSLKLIRRLPLQGPDHLIQILYGVDSLQDTLNIAEITKNYRDNLDQMGINVPFTISRMEGMSPEIPRMNQVTVGFANPITYRVDLGNTVPYLLKRIALPILFSVFLLGITILSFVMLYRSLLRQRRLAEVKNEFISNITHELKTPIATVGVAIEALKNFNAAQNPERTREYLDISANELQRLNLLVDKVLKLSMFEKKEIELKFELLDLKDVVNEVVGSMRLQIEKKNASVSVHYEGDTSLEGDRLHLQSVVFNLLDNALKYSNGSPVIHISLSGSGSQVNLKMTDNGIGIPAEYRDKVFEKFFRIPHGNTHNARGYGLGLSYVAHVVDRHHGSLLVESKVGEGSSFIITLPKTNT